MPDLVVDIAVNIAVHKTFHYRMPEEMADRCVPGSRVLVPFGSRRIEGTVVGFPARAEVADLKSVIGLLDNPLTPELLDLARWIADYYLHPLGQTIEALVPKAVSRTKPKMKRCLQIVAGDHDLGSVRGPKQRALLLLLCDRQVIGMEELKEYAPGTIRSLCDAKIATIIERAADEMPNAATFSPSVPPELMPAQYEAVRRINEAVAGKAFGVFLLHGVTGSGKTEVYLHAISGLADTGKAAIVLVPEIALTPQLLGRFRKRFGDRVAVLHSGLTDRERADE
jgi:primosomal protein N' (replication factor Y)